jgi:hypothetical protein
MAAVASVASVEMVGYAPLGTADLRERNRAALTHPTEAGAANKKPGAVSRPGTALEFQFHE